LPGELLCEHRIPIVPAWQGFRKDCPRAVLLDTMLSGESVCL
jgi:hypothetical protein